MGFEWMVANLSRVHLQISDSPMSAVSGDHDDDDDGSKKDGVGVPQLIVDTGQHSSLYSSVFGQRSYLSKSVHRQLSKFSFLTHRFMRSDEFTYNKRGPFNLLISNSIP